MGKKINLWSFTLSIICILLFLVVTFSGLFDDSILGTHPLHLVLYMTLATCILGLIGVSGIEDWKGMIRSIATVIFTLGLSVFLAIVLLFGSLLR